MHRLSYLAALCATFIGVPAYAQNAETYAALERIGEIAARIENVYCPADEMRAFDGAIAGVNAARGESPPVEMRTRDMGGFADAIGAALNQGGDRNAIERAAIDGMIGAFDASNGLITTADAQRARAEEARATVTWRVEGGAAVITITTFSEDSGDVVRDALREIQRSTHPPTGFVLDLRGNQGGLLDQVTTVADHFIDGGDVMVVQPFGECASDEPLTFSARAHDLTEGGRLIVLVNAETASGAEMLAATLRERRGATLVGQPTLGNASVHTVIPLNGARDGFLKLRTGTMTTPSGTTWDRSGLIPDRPVPAGEDALTQALATLRQ